MAGKLTDELEVVVQRSGTNTGRMRTEEERAAFATNVRKDIASITYQLNVVYNNLVKVLSSEQQLNALDYGLSGNVVFTHIRATAASAEAYWSDDLQRARTIKETIDVLLAEIARLENELQAAIDSQEYDDTGLRALVAGNSLDLQQLARDTMGPNYTLDGDGLPNLTYSLSQALDAIGAFFSGYPGSGNSYTTTYPALSLTVNLSDVVVDTTLAQSVITGLPADLTAIRTFIGMDTAASTTGYAAHGTIVFVLNGDSLEVAVQKLDAALATHASRHITGGADEIDGDQLDIDFTPANYVPTTAPVEASDLDHLTAHLAGIDILLGGHASRHITGGADEIDGDQLDIDWTPSNYTPTISPVEVSNLDHLTAHLAGIDAALASAGLHAATHISGAADEIDGDQLDIDWNPTNYTPDVAPAEASSVDHLTAHLYGIDQALGAAASTATLQDAYDNGAAATAGDIQLLNADGEIRFLNDTVSALTNIFTWVDDASADIGHLTNTGLSLVNNAYLEWNESTSPPAAVAGVGRAFVDTGSGGGTAAELYYRNDEAGDGVAQITRDGIVKELELGSEMLLVGGFGLPAAGLPGAATRAYPTNGMVYNTLEFDGQEQETCYVSIGVPLDEDGNPPTRLKVQGYFLPGPVGGPISGTGFAFELHGTDGTNFDTIKDNANADPGWTAFGAALQSKTGIAASTDTVQIIDWQIQSIFTAGAGLLNLRLRRAVADAADDISDDVGLIGLKVTWYR